MADQVPPGPVLSEPVLRPTEVVVSEADEPPVPRDDRAPRVVSDVVCDGRAERGADRRNEDDEGGVEAPLGREVSREREDELAGDWGDDPLHGHQEEDSWIPQGGDDARDPLREPEEQRGHGGGTWLAIIKIGSELSSARLAR